MRVALAAAMLTIASTVRGQLPASPRPLQIVIAGGATLPVGKFGDVHDLGLNANASLLFNGTGLFRFRPEISYARFNVKNAAALLSATAQSGASTAIDPTTLLSGLANIEYALGGRSIRPYLLGGVGAVSLSSNSATGSIRDSKAMVNVGAGFRFQLGSMSGFLEGRVNDIPSDQFKSSIKQVRTIPVTFGIVF